MIIQNPLVTMQVSGEQSNERSTSEKVAVNRTWDSNSTRIPKFSYSKFQPQTIPLEQPVEYNNEYNLSTEETTTFAGKIESQTILQFLNKSKESSQKDLAYELSPISSTTNYRPEIKPAVEFTKNFQNLFYNYFKISMLPIGLHGSSQPMSNYKGLLFLYDPVAKTPASEEAHFKYNQGKISFYRTSADFVIFKVPKSNSNIVLVCILLTCDKSKQKNDENLVQEPPSAYVPYASSYASLNVENGETNFAFSWLLLDQVDSLLKIGQPPAGTDPTIMLIGKLTIQQLSEESFPEYCTTPNYEESKPLLVMHFPSLSTDPTPVITLTSLVFTFNSVPATDYTCFRCFLCDSLTDINNPKGLVGFAPIDSKQISDVYTSTLQKPGKKVMFPDIVRFYPQQELSKQAHIIVQFVFVQGKTQTVYKDAVIELFNNSNPISSVLMQFPTNQVKNLSGDYITKSKDSVRSALFVSIDLPPNFYPQQQFIKLNEALVPMQVDWKSIIMTDPRILRKQVLPTFTKLLSIISPITISYIINLLSMFEGDKEVKDALKSWIYNCFDTKQIKHNFLSAFTNALDQFMQESIEKDLVSIKNIISNFDIISAILLVSFLQKTEEWVPASLITVFTRISEMECSILTKKTPFQINELSSRFGYLVFIFSSLIDSSTITKVINSHIRALIHNQNTIPALTAIFDFLIPFTQTTDFVVYYSTRLPIRPLNTAMFSPFQPTLSLIFLSIGKSLLSENHDLIKLCCDFIARLTLPLESIQTRTRFRVGYSLFPLLDMLITSYDTILEDDERKLLISTTLFLLGYIPRIQIQKYFETAKKNIQSRILNFISSCVRTCISQLTPTISVFNKQLNELTKRVLMFLNVNITMFEGCIQEAVDLISIIASNKYQIPRNYPRIFLVVSQIIQRYPCQRSLVNNLLSMLSMKQHIARCFAATLTLLFFKADFDARKNVVVSSAEVLDELTTQMLNQPTEMIPLYKLALKRINEHSAFFKSQTFSSKVSEKLASALNIADVIMTMRHTAHEPAEKCVYVMQIANQYISYPSMRMKWLSEIVSINKKNNCYSAAFVAQLHICALISTVIEHEQRIKGGEPTISPPKQHNLLVCQPFTFSKPTTGREIQLYNTDFEFIPSVLVETKIDFASVNDDFKFISSDFTLDLLKKALDEALIYGEKAHLYYSMRCIRSIQMRIFAASKQFTELANTCKAMESIFRSMSANVTSTYDIPLVFYVSGKHVFCLDYNAKPEGTVVYPQDMNHDKIEHPHAWSIFRTCVSKELIPCVSTADAKELTMVQYTLNDALPRYTMCSEIRDTKEVKISLKSYADIETDKLCRYMHQCSEEFERCFPFRNLTTLIGSHKMCIERDLRRVIALIDAAHGSNDSLFETLKILKEKGGDEFAHMCAQKLSVELQRLVKVYHRAIEYLESEEHYIAYAKFAKSRLAFTSYFGLPEIDTRGYEGRRDPISEKFDYE